MATRIPGRHWKLSEIDWERIDRRSITPGLIWIIRATCLVESRADLYASYVGDVLRGGGRREAESVIESWGEEEAQHGTVLQLWLERADPTFHFRARDGEYRQTVRYYEHTGRSVRGSVENELLCRCVVESLASAYYRAIRDSTSEPVLRDICERLARDETRHYKMFRQLLERERQHGRAGLARNLWAAYLRIKDLENDQIAFAFFCTLDSAAPAYSTRSAGLAFLPKLYGLYRFGHVRFAAALIFQALDLRLPPGLISAAAALGLVYIRARAIWMKAERAVRGVLRAG